MDRFDSPDHCSRIFGQFRVTLNHTDGSYFLPGFDSRQLKTLSVRRHETGLGISVLTIIAVVVFFCLCFRTQPLQILLFSCTYSSQPSPSDIHLVNLKNPSRNRCALLVIVAELGFRVRHLVRFPNGTATADPFHRYPYC